MITSREVVASDILAGVLSYLDIDKFSGNPERLHQTFARMRGLYPILRPFTFTSRDNYPFSRLLEDSFSILQRSRLIRMENPSYDTYLITDSARSFVQDHIIPLFGPDEQQQLKELASIFAVECGSEIPIRL